MDILVVDDDEKIGKMFADVFKDDGHNIHSVLSGEDAVEAYKKAPFDVVFLDMILPGMNGLKTLTGLKAIDPNVHVVIMTGYSVLGLLEDAAKAGIVTTLIKPFHISQVKNAVIQAQAATPSLADEKSNSVLIIDEWQGLAKNLSAVFQELNFITHTCKNISQLKEVFREKDFDLILISVLALEKDTMQTFNFMKEKMPTSKCVMLIDEHMDLAEVSGNIKEMFKTT